MAITEQDLQLYARRIRTHFSPSLQDVAEELAFTIAQSAGSKVKLLRPETTLDEIIGWMESLDAVEALMAWDEEFKADLPALLDRPRHATFRDLVQRIAVSRRSRR